jgi:methylamine dehydrogenase heavy chain
MAANAKRTSLIGALALLAGTALTATALAQTPPVVPAAPATPPPILEAETSDIATLPPATPHRYFVSGRGGGVTIINGDTAKIEGTVNSSGAAGFAAAPDNSAFYISETIWTRQNRGKRQDLLSIYDGTTLNLVHEVELPGRLIASGRVPFFSISANGERGFVYNMEPAASVITVDLAKRKVLSVTETPGCGMIYPFRDEGFASLCADGALASTVLDAKGKASITHTAPFFDVEKDPVFEESLVDRKTGKALFITYSGMVYPADLGAQSKIGEGWSLQKAAGYAAATSAPQHKTWRPGGRRPFALHRDTNRLFVLMHEGKPWTQKAPGNEVWVLDTVEKTLIARYPVPTNGYVVSITQDKEPLLYVVSDSGALWVLNPETGKLIRNLDGLGRPALAAVVGF